MEEFGGAMIDGIILGAKKKRSQTSRRPRPDSNITGSYYLSPSSSSPPFHDYETAVCDTDYERREFNGRKMDEGGDVKNYGKNGDVSVFYRNEPGRMGYNNKRCSEGVLGPANWKNASKVKDNGLELDSRKGDLYSGRNDESSKMGQTGVVSDGLGSDNRVKKVKLKVGGVTRTIQTTPTSNGALQVETSTKSSGSDSASRKHNVEATLARNNFPSDKRSGLQGIPWKDFSKGGFNLEKEDFQVRKMSEKRSSEKQGEKFESARKSKRVPKRHLRDEEFDEDEDDEVRYLEKLKTSKVTMGHKEDDEEPRKKQRKLSSFSNMENVGALRSVKDGKSRSMSDRLSEETECENEQELGSDTEMQGKKKSNQSKEITLTSRQRALRSSKDASSAQGGSLIEFPNGLPPAPPRKQKEKLTNLEQQLKKAEAAQRRKMQVEKAARESEAEVIRKILSQDSNRKKQEEKMKKRQEELAQEKEANAQKLASHTVRWVMGPTGTVVIFPNEMGLPSLFNPKPCSYPPPRENCVGPSCTNAYKYRDSKFKLPLCSLQCYKAVQEKMFAETI